MVGLEAIQLASNTARDQAVLGTLTQKMPVHISLHSLDGRIVRQWLVVALPSRKYEKRIPLEQIEKGLYILKIKTKRGVVSRKLMVTPSLRHAGLDLVEFFMI